MTGFWRNLLYWIGSRFRAAADRDLDHGFRNNARANAINAYADRLRRW
jgi:hypothetical protein